MRLQINLRWFLILTAALGVGLGLAGRYWRRSSAEQTAREQVAMADLVFDRFNQQAWHQRFLSLSSGMGSSSSSGYTSEGKRRYRERLFTPSLPNGEPIVSVHLQVVARPVGMLPAPIEIKDFGGANNQAALKEMTAAFDQRGWNYKIVKAKPVEGESEIQWPENIISILPKTLQAAPTQDKLTEPERQEAATEDE